MHRLVQVYTCQNATLLEVMYHGSYEFWVLKLENYFSHFSTKIYVVGTQKDPLIGTVLMSTQNI